MHDKRQKGEGQWGLSQVRAPFGDWDATNVGQAFWPDSGGVSSSLQIASAVSTSPADGDWQQTVLDCTDVT